MASDQTLRAIITVLDRTAEPMHQINARFAAMAMPLRDISSRIGELAEESGLKAVGEHARGAFEHVRHLGEGLLELAGPLAALGAAGSIAGLVEIAKSTGEFAERLDIAAAKTGIATETLSGWHYAAGLVNVDVDQLDKGFTFLNRNIALAAGGKAKDVEAILAHMGFSNTPGHLVNTADALRAVAAEVKHLTDNGQIELATAMMSKLFGARQGANLLPLFEQGPEGLAKIMDQAKEAGISLSAAQTASGHEFMEQFKGMTASVEGLKIAIGDELFPVLTPVIESTRDWLNANREWIATNVGEAVHKFGAWLRDIDWKGIGTDLHQIADGAAKIVDKIGGIGPAIAIVAAISLSPAILAFTELGGAVLGASAKLVVFPAVQAIAAFASLVPAIGGLTDAWAALDVVMDANPLGVAIIAATALAAVDYEIYQHWSGIAAFFQQVWDKVVAIVEAGWARIQPIVRAIETPFQWLGDKLGATGAVSPDAQSFRDRKFGPRLGTQPPLSEQPGAAAAVGGGAAPQGQTKVTIDMQNVPPGTRVQTENTGNADAADVNVGYAMVW